MTNPMPYSSKELMAADELIRKVADTFRIDSHEGLILTAARNIMAQRTLELIDAHIEEANDGPHTSD